MIDQLIIATLMVLLMALHGVGLHGVEIWR